MVKLKNPLLSLEAIGRVTKAITFAKRRKTNVAEKYPVPTDAKSLAQLSWRHMYQKAVALWHALSADEKQDWESQARSRHMTGFAWFMSQALKPNPGLYLPLQGGTMTGDIDMAKNRILKLPAPTDPQEALRLFELTNYIYPYLYLEGARVYHNVDFTTGHNVATTLGFNSERWDNDSIHSTTIASQRLTCQTAGKYLIIAQVGWALNVVGERRLSIFLNTVTEVGQVIQLPVTGSRNTHACLSTIYDLSLGDFLTIVVLQNSGGPLSLVSRANYSPEFMMQRIG